MAQRAPHLFAGFASDGSAKYALPIHPVAQSGVGSLRVHTGLQPGHFWTDEGDGFAHNLPAVVITLLAPT